MQNEIMLYGLIYEKLHFFALQTSLVCYYKLQTIITEKHHEAKRAKFTEETNTLINATRL